MSTFPSEDMAQGIFFEERYIYFFIHINWSRVTQNSWQTLSTSDFMDSFTGHVISGWCYVVGPTVGCSVGWCQHPAPIWAHRMYMPWLSSDPSKGFPGGALCLWESLLCLVRVYLWGHVSACRDHLPPCKSQGAAPGGRSSELTVRAGHTRQVGCSPSLTCPRCWSPLSQAAFQVVSPCSVSGCSQALRSFQKYTTSTMSASRTLFS